MFESFESLNEIESYILGFLYADGSITTLIKETYYTLSIALAEKDKDFLQFLCDFFNKELNKEYTLKYNSTTKSYRLSVCNVVLIKKLISLGIVPNKTYQNNCDFFKKIPKELKIHFIRGFYDGDGSICKGKDNKYRVSLVSLNSSLLEEICNFTNETLNTNFTHVREDGKYTRVSLSGNVKCKTWLDLLYNNSNYYLDRKFQKYKEITTKQKPIHPHISWHKKNLKWVVYYHNKISKNRIYLGTFKTIKECVERYNQEAIKNNDLIMEYKGEYQYE